MVEGGWGGQRGCFVASAVLVYLPTVKPLVPLTLFIVAMGIFFREQRCVAFGDAWGSLSLQGLSGGFGRVSFS